MTKIPRPRQGRSRAQESPELVARLERSRQRSLQRRAAATEREKTITRVVGEYLAAWNAITNTEQRRDREVGRLREQIDTVIARASAEITGYENAQEAAAAAVRAHVQTDEDVADLLEITLKRARQLLSGSRARTPRQPKGRASSNSAGPTHPLIPTAPVGPGPIMGGAARDEATDVGPVGAERPDVPEGSTAQRTTATSVSPTGAIASKRKSDGATSSRGTYSDTESPQRHPKGECPSQAP